MKIKLKTLKQATSFLAIGKTQESTESGGGFKRYIGVGSSFIKAVNPHKAELDALLGYESQSEPEYVKDGDSGKEVQLSFIVASDPESCNGIDIKNRMNITMRLAPAYSKDGTKVQVIDDYGNHTWVNVEDAKAGKAILLSNGNPQKIDVKYRMACVGECDLVDLLKAYLCVPDAFDYVNGVWVKKENASEYLFKLEHIKDYFNGDFSELRDAIALQPNNKVKLLYGVRTSDGKQYQTIATKGDLILRNSAGSSSLTRLEKNLASAKQGGAYSTTEFRVCELQEYTVQPTNLDKPSDNADLFNTEPSALPWD